MARLKPGRGIEQTAGELASIGTRLQKSYPDSNKGRSFMVWPLHRKMVDSETEQYLKMLLGSVVFVLLIACVNVANLQFARATGRLREVAVRTALGAGRVRVIVQLVTESVLLSLTGAIFGLIVAKVGIALIRNNMPPEIQRYILGWQNMQLDDRALLFTLAAAGRQASSRGLATGVAVLCARTSRRYFKGGGPRIVSGRRQAPSARHPGGHRDRTGSGAAGGRRPDGARLPKHAGGG